MPSFSPFRGTGLVVLSLLLVPFAQASGGDVVVSEIMYHPAHAEGEREPVELEFVELHNTGGTNVDLTGWRIDRGVAFTFGAATLEAGGFVVVAADPAAFAAAHPGAPEAFGPWSGQLSNSGESIRLVDAAGAERAGIAFADEGDWSTRTRGPLDRGHQGWIWDAPHDGRGRSLELINPLVAPDEGQNWGPSTPDGGTPGAPNSIAAADIAPVITGVRHRPKIPSSSDSVTVSAELIDEIAAATATLHYRVDETGGFVAVPMTAGSGGRWSAVIPPQANRAVVEFHVEAADAGGKTRTWPAPVSPGGSQQANALYQVDDSFDPFAAHAPGDQPTFRIIMTPSERDELARIGSVTAESESNAQMNATFIAADSFGVDVRYLAGVRNRGARSRTPPPNNHLVIFRSDDRWEGRKAVKFNARNIASQVAGSVLFRRFGIEAAAGGPVQLRVNGINPATGTRMYGSYVMLEALDSEFAENHWPDDAEGNLYQVRDDIEGGELQYEGENPAEYQDSYFKQTNQSAADYSDLIRLTDGLNNAPAAGYIDAVEHVADLDQWTRYLAVDALLGNLEGGLTRGRGDDYALYRGVADPRFVLVPHDYDTLLDFHELSPEPNRDIFVYEGVTGLARLFAHPDFLRRYYAAYLGLIEGDFRPDVVSRLLDEALGGWVPDPVIQDGKDFIAARIAGVLAQIPRTFSAATNLAPAGPQGHLATPDGAVDFSGAFHAARTRSIVVNGREAAMNVRTGRWSLSVPSDDPLLSPGLNAVAIRFLDGPGGSGTPIHEERLTIWNQEGGAGTPLSGTLVGGSATGSVSLQVRDSYLPGIPVLVRVEVHDEDGNVNRNVWDATATLATGSPNVVLTPSQVTLFNGRGSALVQVSGVAGGGPGETILARGAVWRYLDDGSNQGTAWRAPAFDDSAWENGPAELGYGDNQATTVGFVDTNPGQAGTQKNATTYFRRTFTVDGAAGIAALTARLKYDDGAIVYLNGTELFKTANMVSDMAFDQFTVGGQDTPDEDAYHEFTGLDAGLLVEGANTIAVEIHQGDASSSDISFDFELVAFGPSADPGNFTLSATLEGRSASRSLVSLAGQPVVPVSGTLPVAGETTWSGIVRVTDDLTVPAGHTLRLAPGTLVLVDGDAAPMSTAGKDLIVNGRLLSEGTAASPATITATDPSAPWGQILFQEAAPSSLQFTEITRGGHSPRGGHTGHGRVIRLRGSSVTFANCSITDHRGKVGETDASGGNDSNLVVRHCHLARSVMGFETFDTGVLVEDSHITEMLGIYREDGITDDDDAIYLHAAGPGQDLVLRRLVVARTDDDGIDTLGAEVVAEDVISRNCFDKGISILGGSFALDRALVVENDIGISAKDGSLVSLESATLANNQSISLQVENKTGSDAPSLVDVRNSILDGPDSIRTDYDPADVTVAFSIVREPWAGAGAGVIDADPAFRSVAGHDYRLSPGSPAIDAADPLAPPDPDGSAADLGYHPFVAPGPGGGESEVVWLAAAGPYHIVDDVVIPDATTLVIEAGTSVFVDAGKRLTINGRIQAVGTAEQPIRLSPVPNAALVPDPVGRGLLPDAPPKWDGIKIVDSPFDDNVISHAVVDHAQDSEGAIAVFRSTALIDHVTFSGTHLRMVYTDDASVIVQHCTFPDMFAPNERADELGLDNISEHVKGVGGVPEDGHYIIRFNTFGINKGHNDCIDVESSRRPNPILQVIGNAFSGAGDELLDLGGDVYVADNLFRNVFKDDETSDRGYANAISTGDGGPGTTINVVRNVFWDVDHAINLKIDTATIFENNSVYKIHPDFIDRFDNPSIGSVVNLFIPTDINPQPGDGAYLSGNLFQDLPRVFGDADKPGARVSPLEMHATTVDPAMEDESVGPNHPGLTVHELGDGNVRDLPGFVDPDAGDFRLRPGSPGIGTGPLGQDRGALVPEGAWIAGEPDTVTTLTSAELIVGGPGIFAFRWKLDDGPWSDPVAIGDAFAPPAPTVRHAVLPLAGLSDGPHAVEVIGQTFAGEWQVTPTRSRTWTVAASLPAAVRINELLADNRGAYPGDGSFPDFIELHNPGTSPLDLGGFAISDDPDTPAKHVFAPGLILPAGGFLVLHADASVALDGIIHLGFSLDRDGEGAFLFGPAAGDGARELVDGIAFGPQAADFSLGRAGFDAGWRLCHPSPGAPNVAARLGDPSEVRIGEWFAAGEVAYGPDFIELVNPGPLPVDLSGFLLTDHPSTQPALFRLAQHSFVAPGGVALVLADGAGAAGPSHAGFRLSREGGMLGFSLPDGTPIQTLLYGFQVADFTNLAVPGGEGAYAPFRLPTPGVGIPAPGSPDEAELNRALALFDFLRITEVMYDPAPGSEYEFVELTNTGPATLDLTGVRFTDGIAFEFPPLALAPGESTVVVANRAAFDSLYGAGLNVAGTYAGKLDNGGERLTLTLPPPFDAAILSFRYDDAWFPETDGRGRSLVVASSALPRSAWNEHEAWTASDVIGGHPAGGSVQESGFPAWLASFGIGIDDSDADGIAPVMEYGLGLLPNIAENPDELIAGGFAPAGTTLVFRIPNPPRPDVTLEVLASPTTRAADWMVIASSTQGGSWNGPAQVALVPDGAGWTRVQVTEPAPNPPARGRRFYVLRVRFTP